MRLSSSRSSGRRSALSNSNFRWSLAEVHDEAERRAPRLRDLAEGRLQAVDLGLRLLADRRRFGLGLGGRLAGARGLLARRVRLLAGAGGLRLPRPAAPRRPRGPPPRRRSPARSPAGRGPPPRPSWRTGRRPAAPSRPCAPGSGSRRSPIPARARMRIRRRTSRPLLVRRTGSRVSSSRRERLVGLDRLGIAWAYQGTGIPCDLQHLGAGREECLGRNVPDGSGVGVDIRQYFPVRGFSLGEALLDHGAI